jgi:hypothetical protein
MTKKTDDATPSAEEIAAAEKEGVLKRVKEAANTQKMDELKGEGPKGPKYFNLFGTNQIEHLTDIGLDALEKAIDPKADEPLDENVVANLLALERNGKNRTDFVQLLMKRLKIKGYDDLRAQIPWAGGPDYTNDVTAVSKL